jgi:DNA mismatch endonuclease, patch repair protein
MKRERKCIRSRAPAASSPSVRRVMQAVKRQDTAAEILLRRRLHSAGLRFRKEVSPEPGLRCKADVVFPRQKVCVFIDGCFWHRCPAHFKLPRANSAWWGEKIQATVERDGRQQQLLESRGWTVLRFWEHCITPTLVDEAVCLIEAAVRLNKRAGP